MYAQNNHETKLLSIQWETLPTREGNNNGFPSIQYNNRSIFKIYKRDTCKAMVKQQKITYYEGYVDDMLIIYDQS